jgi:uncharacterized protein YxeA
MVKSISVAVGLALMLAAVPADAANKNKTKTVTGCVSSSSDHYALSAVTKKGKHKEYTLAGKQNFQAQAGHKVQARGTVKGSTLSVSSIKDLSPSCQ